MSDVQQDEKQCPLCAEVIQQEASKCPHCQSQIAASEAQPVRDGTPQNEPGLAREESKKVSTPRPPVRTVFMIVLVGATMVAFLAMLAIGHEPHSIGLTPDELRQRFKHPEPGAFELTPFYRNPDTGDLECLVRGIDRTTKISARVRDSDKKILSITLRWDPPLQDSAEETRHNSTTQFFVTFGLLAQAIDSSLSKDERNQLLYDLRLGGTSASVSRDSQSSRDGFMYRTRWSGNKLALTVEPEKEIQSQTRSNPQVAHGEVTTGIAQPHPQSQNSVRTLALTPDDVALQQAINKLNTLNFPDYPDGESYKRAMLQLQLVIAKLYEKRGDLGRAADYYGMMMTGLGGPVPELQAKRSELLGRIQANPKLNHPDNRQQIHDPAYSK